MVKDREQIIQEMYEDLLSIPRQVYSVFAEYFGEDKVDLQNLPTFSDFQNLLRILPIRNIFTTNSKITNNDWFKIIQDEPFDSLEESHPHFQTIATNFISSFRDVYNSMWVDPYILVKFGDVTVTNEQNHSILINGLWSRVYVCPNGGTVGFQLIRSEFNHVQFRKKYIHSHVRQLQYGNLDEFKIPCLGGGPISNTINTLNSHKYDQNVWRLFCFELEKYVQVESLSGGPYNRLSYVTDKKTSVKRKYFSYNFSINGIPYEYMDLIKSFIEYLIKKEVLKFNYVNGSYGIAMSYVDYMVLLSNEFINFYNFTPHSWTLEELFRDNLLVKGIIDGTTIQFLNDERDISDFESYNGKKLFTFKGEDVTLAIFNNYQEEDRGVIFLHNNLSERILKAILDTINANYGTYDKTTELYYTKKRVRVI